MLGVLGAAVAVLPQPTTNGTNQTAIRKKKECSSMADITFHGCTANGSALQRFNHHEDAGDRSFMNDLFGVTRSRDRLRPNELRQFDERNARGTDLFLSNEYSVGDERERIRSGVVVRHVSG